jgi:hypothetical protein
MGVHLLPAVNRALPIAEFSRLSNFPIRFIQTLDRLKNLAVIGGRFLSGPFGFWPRLGQITGLFPPKSRQRAVFGEPAVAMVF